MPIRSMEEGMKEFKEGEMHSGSKSGPKVTSRKQAIAISLNSVRRAKGKSASKSMRKGR